MPFLAISCFLAYANLIAAVRHIHRNGRHSFAWCITHWLACLAASIGFLLGIELLAFGRYGAVAGDAYNWSPVAYLAFGLVSLVAFSIKLVKGTRARSDGQRHGIWFGMTLWAVLASLYICGTTIDHLAFFRDLTHAGQVDASLLERDLTCSSGTLLVRIEGDTAVYRCPISLILGRDYLTTFAPWPSYIEGTSTTLKRNIDAVMDPAGRQPGVVVVPASAVSVTPYRSEQSN